MPNAALKHRPDSFGAQDSVDDAAGASDHHGAMNTLSTTSVQTALREALDTMAQHQRPDGAIVNPELGIDDPSHCGTGLFIAACARLSRVAPASRAAEYLLAYQRASGLIDMRSSLGDRLCARPTRGPVS